MESRTLFILDGSQAMREFSGFMIDCDINVQMSGTPGIKVGSGGPRTVGKSFWTCNCEAVLEYGRVMFDIFGDDRRVAMTVAEGESLTPILPRGCSSLWDDDLTSSIQYLEALFPFTRRIVSGKSQKVLRHGAILKNAIALLADGKTEDAGGRIVFLTRLSSAVALDRLKDALLDAVRDYGDNWPLMQGCSVTVVHTNAVGSEPKMFSVMPCELAENGALVYEVTSAFSGKSLTTCLYSLAMKQHSLILTTIQGIPMKEEQGAGQSVNYDVELLHPASVYSSLVAMPDYGDFIGTQMREGVPLKMACMRWSTPKLSPSSDVQFRLHSFSVSPLDMNSKPTQCLVQFLLNGRVVVLEPPKNAVAKNLTYSMMSVKGEILLQAFITSRLPCEDACDYCNAVDKVNVSHLSAVVRAGKLQPCPSNFSLCSDASLTYLNRLTVCCPLLTAESLLANSGIAKSFVTVLAETLKTEAFPECTRILEFLVAAEQRSESIVQFPPSSRMRGKVQKPDAAVSMLWAEIMSLLAAYTHISTRHRQLFEYACNLKPPIAGLVNSKALSKESIYPHEDLSTAAPVTKSSSFLRASIAALPNPSRPHSPAPIKKMRLANSLLGMAVENEQPASFAATSASVNLHPVGESFLTMVTTQMSNRRKPREFIRRLPSGKVAELYVGFAERAAKLSKDGHAMD